jgi:hypothetical protein
MSRTSRVQIMVEVDHIVRNVLDEGLRIGEIGRRMNSKVKLVEIGMRRK